MGGPTLFAILALFALGGFVELEGFGGWAGRDAGRRRRKACRAGVRTATPVALTLACFAWRRGRGWFDAIGNDRAGVLVGGIVPHFVQHVQWILLQAPSPLVVAPIMGRVDRRR